MLFPFPSNPCFPPQVQSTPFIMTMPVSLTKDDPSCGYKLPQDPHIGFLPSLLQNLTIPSYLALNVGEWRWIASFPGDASPLTMTHFHDMVKNAAFKCNVVPFLSASCKK
ncbi:hypothetical protein ANTRET_LOCUS3276 [Anthophora retusa]